MDLGFLVFIRNFELYYVFTNDYLSRSSFLVKKRQMTLFIYLGVEGREILGFYLHTCPISVNFDFSLQSYAGGSYIVVV